MQKYLDHIQQLLHREEILSLATVYQSEPWNANYFYICDDTVNVYFSTYASSKNSLNLRDNHNAVATIFNCDSTIDFLEGVQLIGTVDFAKEDVFKEMFEKFNTKFPHATDSSQALKDNLSEDIGMLMKFHIEEIHYRNSKLFDGKQVITI